MRVIQIDEYTEVNTKTTADIVTREGTIILDEDGNYWSYVSIVNCEQWSESEWEMFKEAHGHERFQVAEELIAKHKGEN